jgi:putative transposase
LSNTWRNRSPEFKVKLALAAVRKEGAVASGSVCMPARVHAWKKTLLGWIPSLFAHNRAASIGAGAAADAQLAPLYKKSRPSSRWSGLFSQKVWAMNGSERLALVAHDDPVVSVVAQCRRLKVARSSLYYRPAPVSANDLAEMDRDPGSCPTGEVTSVRLSH